jgi:PAS domain S-box-containing protein
MERADFSQIDKIISSSKNNFFAQNNNLFETIFQHSDIGIILEDTDGNILNTNPAFQKMLGYSEVELLTMNHSFLTHPHDLRSDQKLLNELTDGKRNQYSLEKRYITKSGLIFYAGITRFEIFEDDKRKILTIVQNHSSQQQTINELTSNQNLFTALLENSTDSIYYKDRESKFIKANLTVARNHGFTSPEQLLGKTDFDLFNHEHAVETFNDEQEIIRTGKALIGKEEKIVWPDGKVSWVSTSKMPFYNSANEIIGTIGITRDITQHRQTEEQLYNERIFMRTVLNNLPDAIYAKDLEYKKTFANKKDIENLGCKSEEEVIGKTDFDFFSNEVASSFFADDQSVIQSGEPILNREEYYINENGEEKWLLTSKLPLYSENKNIIGLVGIGHDITARRRSEKIREALFNISEAANTTSEMAMLYKRLHEIIQSLIPATNFYLALFNEKTNIISFPYFIDENEQTPPAHKFGKGLIEYVIKNGKALLADSATIEMLKQSGEIDTSYKSSAVWLGVPLILSGKTIGVIVARDYKNKNAFRNEDLQLLSFVSSQVALVIERKRSSDAINKYAEELKNLNTTKDKFFSIIAHDLKNPFITILGFSELLLSDYNELNDEEKLFYIEEMKKSAETSHSLLQNLLQWSRSQTGRIVFQPKILPIDKIILDNIELLKPTAEQKEIKIDYSQLSTINVLADEDMTSTIIRNLISNAIKFTGRKGKINITVVDSDSFVNISVKDSGIGMSEETLQKLFQLDTSYSTEGTEKETGTGLGLILCKEFIEKNGGTIMVESKYGEGSTFHFTLPKPSSQE